MTTDSDSLWLLLCSALIFFQQGGFLCLEAGLTRKKNSINVAFKNVIDLGLTILLFVFISDPLIGWLEQDVTEKSEPVSLLLYQALFCCTCVTIISGAIAERSTLNCYLILVFLVSITIYPLMSWAIWSPNGFLSQIGFIDFAGATTVHSTGGWVALAAILIIGPRTGVFVNSTEKRNVPASSYPFAMLGVLILWLGWMGFNGGSYGRFSPDVAKVAFVTIIGGAVGISTLMFVDLLGKRKINPRNILIGPLAGLVSVTACAPWLTLFEVILVASSGSLTAYFGSAFLVKKQLDDVIDVIPVHLFAGIWSTLMVGVFGENAGLTQFMTQLAGIVLAGLMSFVPAYLFLKLISSKIALRLTLEEEHLGLNIVAHDERTDLIDLVEVMDEHQKNSNYSIKAPVEPFTEVGQLATHYNILIDTVQQRELGLEQSVLKLENINQKLESAQHELEKKHSELETIKSKVEKVSDMKTAFFQHMSHELRTPLNAIIGLSSILSKMETESKKSKFLEKINQAGDHLLSLVEKVMELSLIDMNEMKLKKDHVDFKALCNQMGQIYTPIFNQKNIDFTLDTQLESKHAIGDSIKIKQVLLALLNNAAKFTKEGQIKVTMKTQIDNDYCICKFNVQDTGIGIPKEKQEAIFTPYRQVDAALNREYEGLGIGLAISQGILKLMDGEITLNSNEGQGSEFQASWIMLRADSSAQIMQHIQTKS